MTPEISMPTTSALAILRSLSKASIEIWIDGGWGVDALMGRQTRQHKDLDIILRVVDVPKAAQILGSQGFFLKECSLPDSFVLRNGFGLEVDVHAVVFDSEANGIYRMQNGEDWTYPAEGFTGTGFVNDHYVSCLSPAVQFYCHAHGYEPTDKDFRDMELIRDHFGMDLPSQLTRASQEGK